MASRKIAVRLLAIGLGAALLFPGTAALAMKPHAKDPAMEEWRSARKLEEERKKAEKEAQAEAKKTSAGWGEDGLPPYIPPPEFARNKAQMPDFLLRDKDQGIYVIPIPQIGIDPDTGFNFGMGVTLFNNGKATSPFFRITPYRQQIETTVVATTGGLLQVRNFLDSLYTFESPWRVRSEFEYYHNPSNYYFGIGNAGQQLVFPGTGQVFDNYDAYNDALKVETGGGANSRYSQYGYTRLSWKAQAEYQLLGGYLRPLFGLQVGHVWITDYTGGQVDAVNAQGQDVKAIQNTTHLRADCDAGDAIGCGGGNDFYVKLGMAFDSRNFEPNPSSGIFWSVISELSPKFLGSAFNYGRLQTTIRAFGKVLDMHKQRIVLAGRFLYSWQFGDVPFYSMNTLAFADRDWTGLGGFRSLRGYAQDRYIGPVYMLANAELRYTFMDFTIWNQNIRLGIKPFIDAGRSFSKPSDTTFKGFKVGGGVGGMIVWNLSTVISLDMAFGAEGDAFYMEVGQQF
jgi:hypothetical protein